MGDKVKIICDGCGVEQEFEDFKNGETICTKCGLASLFRKPKVQEPYSPPLPLVDRFYKSCDSCGIFWTEKEINKCPKCGGNKIHGEIIKS